MLKEGQNVLETEDELDQRIKILENLERESPSTLDEFNQELDRELSIFKDGEKYDFVKDIKDAYKDSLSKSQAERILETIPDHTFWDIKTP